VRYPKDDISFFMLLIISQILPKIGNNENKIQLLIDKAYNDIKPHEKQTFIKKYINTYLSTSNFTVAFYITNLRTMDNFKNYNIANIEFLSNKKFKDWQYSIQQKNDNDKPIIFNYIGDDKNNITWLLVKDIECSKTDIDMALDLAYNKANNFLNIFNYIGHTEKKLDCKIQFPSFILNNDNKNLTITNMPIIRPLIIDEIRTDTKDFISEYFSESSITKRKINMALKYYTELVNTRDINLKIIFITKIIKSIFSDTNNEDKLALFSSILIGDFSISNVKITYDQRRLWLYEDFRELFHLANEVGKEPLKERLIERFNTFCNYIITLVWNYFIELKYKDTDIALILNWILSLTPDNKIIKVNNND
jgi:hypothetical protein